MEIPSLYWDGVQKAIKIAPQIDTSRLKNSFY